MTRKIRAAAAAALLVITACGGDDDSADSGGADTGAVAADSGPIPADCFASEDAFDDCWNQGLVPEECIDDEGYLLDACVPADPSTSSGGDSSAAGAMSDGAVTSGFDPRVDAFSFPNYGGEPDVVNLTSAELQRMFGDQVCASQTNGCTLTPPARQWMEQMNKSMSGGHCEGMAVLSSLFYFEQASPSSFGGNATADIAIAGNEALQREIAYWWVTQMTYPGGQFKVNESPSAVLDTLIASFADGKAAQEWWALGIYKRDFSGGHAITPYAVEDQGNGIFHVYVYDNNYPNEGRILIVDRNAETWQYEASINPSVEADLYEGDASTQTLEIVAISPRLTQQQGSFGESGGAQGYSPMIAANASGVEVWLDGDANLLITTADGRKVGWLEDGTFVNEIDGATSTSMRFGVAVWDVDQEPVYTLPGDVTDFTITVDGSQLTEQTVSNVTVIGPGFDMVVEDLILDPGQHDTITVSIDSDEYFGLNYESDYSDSPDIWFGIVTDEADYEFIVTGSDIEPGGSFNVLLDFPNGDFVLNTTGQTEYGVYELWVARIDDEGEYVFSNDEIELMPDDTMYVNFFEWEGDGSPMYLDFDYGTDGSIDDTLVLEDEAGDYADFYED